MSDYAHDMTDKYILDIERRLKKEYARAEQELRKKAEKHFERFKEKDEKMRKALEDKSITKREYKKWRSGQMLVGQRWNDMRDTIAQDFSNTNNIARSIIRGYMPEVYALNHNFGTYQIEKDSGMDTSYTLYSRETVESLMRDNPQLLPDPGKSTENRIYNALDVRYNRQQLQSVATQAVLQGESIPNIAKRLVEEVGEKNRKAAVRNARTMMTCAENKGRMDSYKRAQSMGIECNKRWLATHDNRTRDWHAELDEVSVPVDEPFENRAGKIMYPGDPTARPENVYNCRCRLVSDIKHVKSFSERLKEYEKGAGKSFNEWQKSKSGKGITRKGNILHGTSSVFDRFERRYLGSVDYIKVNNLASTLSDAEIIKKVGGDDKIGACVSQALAYLGNVYGYDVKDYRGGTSADVFGEDFLIKRLLRFKGVKGEYAPSMGKPSTATAMRLLSGAEDDKLYLFGTGTHTAVIKKHRGSCKYLELQGYEHENGWKMFDSDMISTLEDRFNSDFTASSYIVDGESLGKSKDFRRLLGYLNTV